MNEGASAAMRVAVLIDGKWVSLDVPGEGAAAIAVLHAALDVACEESRRDRGPVPTPLARRDGALDAPARPEPAPARTPA